MAETTGPIRAFLAAGRPIPAWAGQDLNELSCLWQDNHAANPTFKLATVSAHTWLVRLALRKGLAAVNGMDNDRAQPDRPAVLRGQHVVGSGARGEMRQEPAADRNSLVDGLR